MNWQRAGIVYLGIGLLATFVVLGVACSGGTNCSKTSECSNGDVCKDFKCVSVVDIRCKNNSDCSRGTPVCNTRTRRCVGCVDDSNCANGQVCKDSRCTAPFKPQCRSDSDCNGKLSRFCSGNGLCEWQCRLNSDCPKTQQCRNNICEKLPVNSFCVTDKDCAGKSKKFCSAAGNCEWDCKVDTDCPNSASCRQNACVTVGAGGCQSNSDCSRADLSKCMLSTGKCVECLSSTDCPANKPRCLAQKCEEQGAKPTSCQEGCAPGEFCFGQQRCLKRPKPCNDASECAKGENCLQLGKGVNVCLPVCDPTQNKSNDNLLNPSCWGDFGWCYSVSDDDPKDGACWPPQLNVRQWKEECGNEQKLDSPTYLLCAKGLACIDDKGAKYCWKVCDPKKNVGGKSDVEDKNPDCAGGKGLCWPLEDGSGACQPVNATNPPQSKAPGPGDLVINEVLADPPAGSAGDANQDKSRNSFSDEFVEIVNVSSSELTLEGVVLLSGGKAVFAFSSNAKLKPKQAVVVFGGGMLADPLRNSGKPHAAFGNALVYTVVSKGDASTSNGLLLTNSGKTILLQDRNQKDLDKFVYGGTSCEGNKDQSVTKSPDLTGKCKLHREASTSQTSFSPGTNANGKAF